MARKKKIPSKPASQYDKVELKGMSIEQVVEIGDNQKGNINNQSMKTVVTSYAERQLLLSTDLDLGVSIKVEDGGKPQKPQDQSR